MKFGVFSQKGGVGKSTIARALAVTYAAAKWDVLLADLDINQSTSYGWNLRRQQAGITPELQVQTFGSPHQALKVAEKYDLTIFDGAPTASDATAHLARLVDLIILPTQLGLDDLQPTVILANRLVDEHGVDPRRIVFALSKTGDNGLELVEARTYLGKTDFHTLAGELHEKTAYRRAQDGGLAVCETTYKAPREKAERLMQSVVNYAAALDK